MAELQLRLGWVFAYVDERTVDAGCAPLAAPQDKPHGQRVGYVRDRSARSSSWRRHCSAH